MSSPSLSPSGDFFHAALANSGTVVFGDGSSSRIAIPKAVLSQIFEEVDNGLRLLRRGGVEIGGLLLGPDPQTESLTVDDSLRLEIEYQFGPIFQLSRVDLDRLEKAISAIREPASEPEDAPPAENIAPKTIVGFYRSATRGDSELRDSDCEILETIEQAQPGASSAQCCLILAPISKLEISVRVVVRQGDRLDRVTATIRRDTLQAASALATVPAMIAERLPERLPVELPSAQPKPEIVARQPDKAVAGPGVSRPAADDAAPGPEKPVSRRPRAVKPPPAALLYSAFGLALVIAIVGGYRWINSARLLTPAPKAAHGEAPQSPRLGFAANPDGPAWKLTWSRDAVDALDPVGATLSIRDGDNQRDIALSASDLSSGTLYYSPQGGELAFRFEVQRNGGEPVAERVRVLEALKPAEQEATHKPPRQPPSRQIAPNSTLPRDGIAAVSASAPTPVVPTVAPTQAGTPPAPTAPTPPPPNIAATARTLTKDASAAPIPPANPQSKEAVASSPTTDNSPATTPAKNTPPAERPIAANATSKENPGDSPKAVAAPSEASVLAVPVPPPAKPIVTAPQVNQTPAQPVAPATQPVQATKNPSPAPAASSISAANTAPSPAPRQATYQGPRPIKQVLPIAPSAGGSVQVQVLVEINAKGKVTKVTPSGPISNLQLTAAATKAAAYWEFDPAKRDGQAVPSEMMLIFKF